MPTKENKICFFKQTLPVVLFGEFSSDFFEAPGVLSSAALPLRATDNETKQLSELWLPKSQKPFFFKHAVKNEGLVGYKVVCNSLHCMEIQINILSCLGTGLIAMATNKER